jgi:DNA-binding NarL/FixJ family response regulator
MKQERRRFQTPLNPCVWFEIITADSPQGTDYEPTISAARTSLGEKEFASAWAQGRSMTFDQVLTMPARSATILLSSTEQAPKVTMKQAIYPDGLTTREVEVLRLVAQGLTDAQVAEQLVISPRTVNNHLTAIYGKIRVSSRSAATCYALEHHLI